ncbi:MAG: hypothetical protein ACR2NX_01290 [Chthoniobacterales bacterium]
MKKTPNNPFGFFLPRVLVGFVLCSIAACLALVGMGVFTGSSVQAQGRSAKQAPPQKPSVMSSESSNRNDVSPPLRNQPPWPVKAKGAEHEANLNPKIPHEHVDQPDPVIQNAHIPALAGLAPSIPLPLNNFDGIPFPGVGCNCAPPDTNGEVGATQYVQMVNEAFQVFNKTTGASVLGPNSISSIWAGFGGVCETAGDGDPVVLYDNLASRWVITQFAGSGVPTHECIAVSTTGDATGSYYRYDFTLGTNFFDYPHLSVWPDGYYMADNVFNSGGTAFLGTQAFAFDRSKMLVGLPASFITPGLTSTGANSEYFLPADLDSLIPPPAGAPAVFVEFPDGGNSNTYKTWRFHVDFATPANSTFVTIASPTAAGYTQLCPSTRACVPEMGSATGILDGIGDRVMFRMAYRNFGDHEAIVGNYSVLANSVAGVRWFELRNITSGTLSIFQESTYQPDTDWRWMGSVAQDNQGNMAVGFSASSPTINPQLRYAGRLAGDPINTLAQGEAHLFDGTGAQTSGLNRWGDYSDLTVDPVDDCTFWYTNEYIPTNGTFNWKTRIGSFKFTQCTPPQKGTAHFTVTNCNGGAAFANATVSIDGTLYGATLAPSGTYDAMLAPGAHTYSITAPTFSTVTGSFSVSNGGTTNIGPVCLQGVPVIANGGQSVISAGPNGALDPGETVTVALGLKNTAGAGLCTTALTGTLQATGGVTSPSGPQNYGAVCGGGPVVFRNFTFTVNPALACGAPVVATLSVVDGATNYGNYTYTFPTGLVAGAGNQNFDGVVAPTLPAGWTSTATGAETPWVTSTTTPFSAPNDAFAPDPSAIGDTMLVSPAISIPGGGATLTFKNNYITESTYDGMVLEISVNGGAFADIITAGGSFVAGGYNATISTSFGSPIGGRMAWSGTSAGGYITTMVTLPAAANGQSIQLKWRMASDNSVASTGVRIDDISLANPVCGGSAPTVNSAVSRLTHGGAGTFDVPLPLVGLTGAIGVEPRQGSPAGTYQLVVTFANPVSVGATSVTTGTGSATSSVASNVVTVNLTGVTDIQRLEVTLGGVSDGSNLGNVRIPVGILIGDTSGNFQVSGTDVSQTKAAVSTGTLNASTFRTDVNVSGTLTSTDIGIVKSKSGNLLP